MVLWVDPLSNHHNIRSGTVEFTSETGGMIHGVAGYFESVLYKDVILSRWAAHAMWLSVCPSNNLTKSDDFFAIGINPATHSPGMFSWFPIFFPIKTPLHVPAGAQVILDFWRLTDKRKVWYEWRVSCKVQGLGMIQWSTLHNVGGRSSSIGLF